METSSHILITPGEPAGIGADILIQLLQESWPATLTAICDPDWLTMRAKKRGMTIPSSLQIIPVPLNVPSEPGKLNPANASYVLECLNIATRHCLLKQADALVTGPVHKGIINEAGIAFHGHTEFLAATCNVKQPIMLFVTPQTKVALVTTHLPLSAVPSAITAEKLLALFRTLRRELQTHFHLSHPRFLVCGLNPHAGEQGHLGREEIDILIPVLNQLRNENYVIDGPLPADTIFTEKHLKAANVIIAMYHDQALPVVKYMSFGHAVNVTLGLPFIRTSVDHGTALDLAGTHQADAGSFIAAVQLAIDITLSRLH